MKITDNALMQICENFAISCKRFTRDFNWHVMHIRSVQYGNSVIYGRKPHVLYNMLNIGKIFVINIIINQGTSLPNAMQLPLQKIFETMKKVSHNKSARV